MRCDLVFWRRSFLFKVRRVLVQYFSIYLNIERVRNAKSATKVPIQVYNAITQVVFFPFSNTTTQIIPMNSSVRWYSYLLSFPSPHYCRNTNHQSLIAHLLFLTSRSVGGLVYDVLHICAISPTQSRSLKNPLHRRSCHSFSNHAPT